jgi:N-acetyl-1-D-myo-inositol-2-amino-2-deoxy-alpha-D-glucopyranoside deacetylase
MALLGELRVSELETACAELGVTEHWYLGGRGRWRDSGVSGSDDPRAFCNADLDQAADELAALVRKVRPQVIVTYDAHGFYGHPDHIQAHRVAWRAYQQACDPARARFYAVTMPKQLLADTINDARPAQPGDGKTVTPDDFPRVGLPEDQVTSEIRADSFLDAKLAAIRAHATQIVVDVPFFEAAGLPRMRAPGTEYYQLLSGPAAVAAGPGGRQREDDLFRGL